MFKVSLLPASYRKRLISNKRKDLIEKVAVIVLFCLLIIYAGIAARYILLNAQHKRIQKQNSALEAQIAELQQYRATYDELQAAQGRIDAIRARDISAMEFVSMVQNARPENIQISAITTQDWQNSAICIIMGDLPSALTLRSAVNELNAYVKTFTENDDYQGCVKQVKIANNGMPVKGQDDDSYSFTIVLSLTDAQLDFDENGVLITTEATTVETTAPTETASEGESSADSTNETTTAADTSNETTAPAEETTTAAEG